jgi:CRP-like cAMP-binding protein
MIDYNQAIDNIWKHFNQITPFSRAEFDRVAELSTLHVLKKGELLYKQGSIPQYGGFVIKGALRHFYTPPLERRNVTTGFHFEDACFGDLRSIFYNEPALTTLQAIETTYIGRLDKLHYLHLFDTCKPFARMMMLSMENKYNELLNETIERIDQEAEQRYVTMLNQYPHILLRVSQRDISSYLGIKPQSLSRIRKNITGRKSSLAA